MILARPTLELGDARKALTAHGFTLVDKEGVHEFWEGEFDGLRRVVLIDTGDAPYSYASKTLAALIVESGIPRRIFYRAAGKPLPWGLL